MQSAEPRRYVVIEQYRLEWLSLVRIPLAIVLIIGLTAASCLTTIWLARMIAGEDAASSGAGPIATIAFLCSLWLTARIIGRIRTKDARTKVEASAEMIRYWAHDGVERSFPNHGVTLVRSGWGSLTVEQGRMTHVLPHDVERAGSDGIEVGPLTITAYRLGVAEGRVLLYIVQASSGSGASVDALPYA